MNGKRYLKSLAFHERSAHSATVASIRARRLALPSLPAVFYFYPVWVARVPRFGGHLLGNLHHFMLENMGTPQDGYTIVLSYADNGTRRLGYWKGHDWRQTCYRFPMRRSNNALVPMSKRNVRDPK